MATFKDQYSIIEREIKDYEGMLDFKNEFMNS